MAIDAGTLIAIGAVTAATTAGASIANTRATNATNISLASSANQLNDAEAQAQRAMELDMFRSSQAFGADQAQQARVFDSSSQNAQNQFAALQAQAGRDFANQQGEYQYNRELSLMDNQQRFEAAMSGTAYQRAVADMKRAGLNPILSAGTGGASTPSATALAPGLPSASSASVSGPVTSPMASSSPAGLASASHVLAKAEPAHINDIINPMVSNAIQGYRASVEGQRAVADINNTNSDTANKVLQGQKTIAETKQSDATTAYIRGQLEKLGWDKDKIDAEIGKIHAEAGLATAQTGAVGPQIALTRQQADLAGQQAIAAGAQAQSAKARADFDNAQTELLKKGGRVNDPFTQIPAVGGAIADKIRPLLPSEQQVAPFKGPGLDLASPPNFIDNLVKKFGF